MLNFLKRINLFQKRVKPFALLFVEKIKKSKINKLFNTALGVSSVYGNGSTDHDWDPDN